MNKFLVAVSVIAITSGAALAQDPMAPPSFGDVSLTTGYTPDPFTVSITSGGSVDASVVSSSCRGWIANAPDFDLVFNAGSLPLTIAASSDSDTTIVVNAPDGSWYCNDDGGEGLNPLLTFNNPQSGLYDIWIGSYSQGDFADATLSISEIGQVASHSFIPVIQQASGPDFTLDPTGGSVSLSAGYTPDPHTASIVSGGGFSARNTSSSCAGWVAAAPDYAVFYQAGGFDLTFGADSDSDTTLMINDPNGNWVCNDDGGEGLNPLITFSGPQSGRYDVWIGSYSEGEFANSTLSVSEIGQVAQNPTYPTNPQVSGPDFTLDPSGGSVNLTAGYAPDPHTARIVSGGAFSARNTSSSCAGWVAAAPDYAVYYDAGGFDLTFGADSDSDTTLMINDPSGNWVCNDDGGDGLNPLITFSGPQSGRYDVWIGSYSEGEFANSTLSVSEIGQIASHIETPVANRIDMSLPASFGSANLSTGFSPDPYRVNIVSGGQFRASSVQNGCLGWVAGAPDYQLTFDGGSLPLILSANSDSDTTILVNDPNGNWHCDDDGGNAGLNPALSFHNPASGVYDIWIGSYAEGNNASASLSISELYSE